MCLSVRARVHVYYMCMCVCSVIVCVSSVIEESVNNSSESKLEQYATHWVAFVQSLNFCQLNTFQLENG